MHTNTYSKSTRKIHPSINSTAYMSGSQGKLDPIPAEFGCKGTLWSSASVHTLIYLLIINKCSFHQGIWENIS